MEKSFKILGEVLQEAFLVFLFVGSLFTLVIGVWMLVSPQSALRLNQYFSKWISTEKFARLMDSPRNTERILYRNHLLVGAFAIGSGLYALYVAFFNFNKKAVIALFGKGVNPTVAAWLVDATVATLVLFGAFILMIGIFLVIRPSLLKGFEAWVNRWYLPEKRLQSLDTAYYNTNEFVTRHIRVVAVLIILGSVYSVAMLGKFVL